MAGMVPADVLALTGVSDPRLDPEGQRVAYVTWWVDGRNDDRFQRTPPGRGVRGGGREETCAAALHAPLLQAGQRRLDRGPPAAPVRGARRRLGGDAAADERRLRAWIAHLVPGREA